MKKTIVRSELSSENKKTKKRKIHAALVREVDVKQKRSGEYVAIIKVSSGVRIATGYQSAGLDIGIEMPWVVRPGNFDDAKEGFDMAYDFVGDELRTQTKHLQNLVQDLAEQYAR